MRTPLSRVYQVRFVWGILGVSLLALQTGCLSMIRGPKTPGSSIANASSILGNLLGVSPDFAVFGQPNFGETTAYSTGAGAGASTLSGPVSVSCGGGYCYVVDCDNNRVLIYSGVPTASSSAIAALGQANLTDHFKNRGLLAPTASTLSYPISVSAASGKLIVSDYYNQRVLIWNTLPTSSVPADVVVGQPDFASNGYNQGTGAASLSTLAYPYGVAYNGTKLAIVDQYNHRVLLYSSLPVSNGAAASNVIGQAGPTGADPNRGGVAGANTLNYPSFAVFTAAAKLLISDSYNNRVLIYNTIPVTDGVSANYAIGQPNLSSDATATTQNGLNYPTDIAESSGAIYIADTSNNRVLYYSAVPTADGAAANGVLGQASYVASTACTTGSPTSTCMSGPYGVHVTGTNLLVADYMSHRVLRYNALPTAQIAADDVIGQANLVSGYPNRVVNPNRNGLYTPTYIAIVKNWLAISEISSNRVVLWDKDHPENGAQYVLGQSDFSGNSANQGGAVGPNTMSWPHGIASWGDQMYVSEYLNNRVMVFDTTSMSNNKSATYFIGQTDGVSNGINQGGAVSRTSLYYPHSVRVFGNRLYVADAFNHRILSYDLPITQNAPNAAAVYLQPDFVTDATACGNQQVVYPFGVYVDANYMIVTHGGGGTAVSFFPFSATGGLVNAVGIFGHTDLTTCTANGAAPAANTLAGNPGSVTYSGGYLMITDRNNDRIVVFNGMPTPSTSMVADYVIGRSSLTSYEYRFPASQDGTRFQDLTNPTDIAEDSDSIYITERWGSRVVKAKKSRIPSMLNF